MSLCAAVKTNAQSRVGALAVHERQGDHYGWAVDYETGAAAREAALRECGAGCSVVLTFGRCGASAADQAAASTAVGWADPMPRRTAPGRRLLPSAVPAADPGASCGHGAATAN